jgi:hypothetical protein
MVYCVWADVRPELQLRMIGRAAQGPIGPEVALEKERMYVTNRSRVLFETVGTKGYPA